MKLRMKIFCFRGFCASRFSVRLKILLFLIPTLFLILCPVVHGMAADCALEPTGENYIGVRYKALLAEDELSETGWVLLFCGNGFTNNGEYQPHFIDLMIKGSWASLYDDPLCGSGFPPVRDTWNKFTIQFGLSDYEDAITQDNDIAAWSRGHQLFPRMYTNIDSRDSQAPDKIMAEYQVDEGGTLEGREIEVSFVREEVTKLPQDKNYFMDPDLEGEQLCKPNSQDDILYRHWIATLKVPSLGINSSVDFYINASQGDKINGNGTLNFMWENPSRPVIERDKYKVIIFDPEVKTSSGEWKKATRFLVDLRTPEDELPLNDKGELIGGYRKENYKGRPAIEASFGYGYTDYVIDGDPNNYESSDATKAVIDLRYPDRERILFDESHGAVNVMTGNLANFTDLIRKEGYTAERLTDGPITYDLLKNYKVLVIGWSSEVFSNSEVGAIVNFVKNGGGLLLMAEGWSWGGEIKDFPLNQIAARFNYTIDDDIIKGEWIDGQIISLLTDIRTHPVTATVSAVHVVSGSSITGSGASEVVISDDRKAVLIAGESGKGRFVFIGDSDVFSNIDYDGDGIMPLNEADNERLGKNVINWLATVGPTIPVGTPKILWIKTYDFDETYDRAYAVATDSNDNIIVTGKSDGEWLTIKYDRNGNELWTKRYEDGRKACGVAVDSNDNIIVVGDTHIGGTWDYLTIKYDRNGNRIWYRRLASGYHEYPGGVAVDSNDNIIVTGRSHRSTDDWFTVKFNSNGDVLWTKYYDGGQNDEANAVAVDSNDNILVTGKSRKGGFYGDYDYLAVKYDPNGNVMHTKKYDSGDENDDGAYGIAVDSNDNFIVTGYGYNGDKIVTIKYRPDGKVVWEKTFEGGEYARGAAVDSYDNIIVAGESKGANEDFLTIKYDSNGNELWSMRYDGGADDHARGVAVDSDNNILVTGDTWRGEDYAEDYLTIKYGVALPSCKSRPGAYTDYTFGESGPFYNLDAYVKWEVAPSYGYIYPAFTFGFEAGQGGYMGTQLIGTTKKVLFSIWDTTEDSGTAQPAHPNCKRFSGEGTGAQCFINYDWQEGREYRLRIWAAGSDEGGEKWVGAIYDPITKQETVIGYIYLKNANGCKGYGWLKNTASIFLEYFGGEVSCFGQPHAKVTWRGPYANSNSYTADCARVPFYPCCPTNNVFTTGYPYVTHEAGDDVQKITPEGTTLW